MAKGMKAIVAAAALGMGLLGAAGAARADQTYIFSITPADFGSFTAMGSFNLNGVNIDSVKGIFTDSGVQSGPVSFPLDFVIPQSGIFPTNSSFYIDAQFGTLRAKPSASTEYFFAFSGNLVRLPNELIGGVYIDDKLNGLEGTGIFTATLENFLNPVSPGSGGPTGGSGGTSTGGAGATGAAPSPEVNTLLGFLVVGGTVVFMKRRRKDGGADGMAVA